MALNITQEQYNTAQAYANARDYKGGWTYLASLGDNYADNAAAVTSGNATGTDVAFEVLVQVHWENTAPGAYADKFDQVATQRFQQGQKVR
ncbi:iron-regulated FrpC domain protein [Methylomonas sp. Kb3]|uniref:iron-regulated FrpC domain protein n=1 Tax=Methylomonas sp. Kb3 TaxID=1611544 RepID=UPI000C32243C|nr:iron-regulated FrpC domain protein [Methylomonas sp. Kb3]PKD40809.1 iron-regulated FrpC domain protein [Methylomonas sp. Kb3]